MIPKEIEPRVQGGEEAYSVNDLQKQSIEWGLENLGEELDNTQQYHLYFKLQNNEFCWQTLFVLWYNTKRMKRLNGIDHARIFQIRVY